MWTGDGMLPWACSACAMQACCKLYLAFRLAKAMGRRGRMLCALLCREAGGYRQWMWEKLAITGRRWRTMLFGRRSMDAYLQSQVRAQQLPSCLWHLLMFQFSDDGENQQPVLAAMCSILMLWVQCADLTATYEPLIRAELHWWEERGITADLLERSADQARASPSVILPSLLLQHSGMWEPLSNGVTGGQEAAAGTVQGVHAALRMRALRGPVPHLVICRSSSTVTGCT
jgi:hypothetical protein